MKGRNPTLKGVLTTDAKDVRQRKSLGKVALWRNESKNSKAPTYRGTVQTEKGNFRIALWESKPDDEGEGDSLF